jgi:hypothetical protein
MTLCHVVAAVVIIIIVVFMQQLLKDEQAQGNAIPSQEVLSELHEVVQAAGVEGEEGCLWGAFNTTKGPTVSVFSLTI